MYDEASGLVSWKARPREHFETHHDWMRFNSEHAGLTAAISSTQSHLVLDGTRLNYEFVVNKLKK